MTAFGVSVLIQKDGLILGIPRRDDPNDFGLIGGKIDDGESEEQAAIRECKEETGLIIFNLKEINRRYCDFPDEAVTFSCEYIGEPSPQKGEPKCKWCKPEELVTGAFGEYNLNLFKKLQIIKE